MAATVPTVADPAQLAMPAKVVVVKTPLWLAALVAPARLALRLGRLCALPLRRDPAAAVLLGADAIASAPV